MRLNSPSYLPHPAPTIMRLTYPSLSLLPCCSPPNSKDYRAPSQRSV
jgi:hypothetical protein